MESSCVVVGEKRKEREDQGPAAAFFYTYIGRGGGGGGGGGGSGGSYDGERAWQSCHGHYKASGTGGVAPMRVFPFTCAQWQELQRQALIYKHIMASVPVPPDLLLPFSARAFPEAPPFLLSSTVMSGGNGAAAFNLRFTNNTDPEPGRCRRTDGKKWRCSRDAAPDQKYCERHMHRGRPRSRKPVELRKSAKSTSTPSTMIPCASVATVSPSNTSQPVGLLPNVDLKLPFFPMEQTKDLENMASNQPWELMHSSIRMRDDTYEDLTNFNYTDLNEQCCSFLNPNLTVLGQNASSADDNVPPARRFIDAWSTDNPDDPVPTLTLSMSNMADAEKTDNFQMGLGLSDQSNTKRQPMMNWMGGPLAEVLHSRNVTASPSASSKSSCVDLNNLMCKSCCGSHEASPRDSPTRLLASSPSGVLHKALVSLSDSSSSSSPTFAATVSRPELAFQWMRQTK